MAIIRNNQVSVIMSVYNDRKVVSNAIISISKQTFRDFEFLIFDDGSTDGTYRVCEKYKILDKRITLFRSDKNEGLTKRLNFLIKKSTNGFIARQDSDDFSYSNRLQKQWDFLRLRKCVSAIGTGCLKEKERTNHYPPEIVSNKIYEKNMNVHGSMMFRKSALVEVGMYNESLRRCQDWELYCKMVKKGMKIRNLHEILYILAESPNPTYWEDYGKVKEAINHLRRK